MLWLYLDFPNLQLDALLAQVQGEKMPPLVILDQRSHNIVQVSAKARAVGINLNMGLGTAAALAQDLQVVPYEPKINDNKLQEIAEILYLSTSDISFFAPQGLLLRINHMLRLYGDLANYWQVIKNQLAPLKLTYHYATGHSPLAAKILAKKKWDTISDDLRLLHHNISQCQLYETDISPKTQQQLTRVGVRTIQDLLAISFADMAKRFDIGLVNYLGRLSAEFKHPIEFYHPPEIFRRYMELLFDIDNSQFLHRPLGHLLQALEQFLKLRDRLTQTLIILFYQREHEPIEWTIGSQQGEYLASRWQALIKIKLEQLRLDSAVYAINLTTGQTQIRSPDKGDLFSAKQGTLSRLQLVSLLQAKLGEKAVMSPIVNDDYRPEHAANYAPPVLLDESNHNVSHILQAMRPSFLLTPPQPLREKVSIVHGPERLNTGWWDNRTVVRDYYIARNQQGQWYWVFKEQDAVWYLHGVFS
ncbi:Y-family DNA polymerase [Flavobacterium sp. W21_SRS_FM6]|uniref:Y-family DNA polymerase n=1 Tax=Flavobacterium sp. W21_SRS_FM6 TaxID=3240268 RepID=UPI003F910EA9